MATDYIIPAATLLRMAALAEGTDAPAVMCIVVLPDGTPHITRPTTSEHKPTESNALRYQGNRSESEDGTLFVLPSTYLAAGRTGKAPVKPEPRAVAPVKRIAPADEAARQAANVARTANARAAKAAKAAAAAPVVPSPVAETSAAPDLRSVLAAMAKAQADQTAAMQAVLAKLA